MWLPTLGVSSTGPRLSKFVHTCLPNGQQHPLAHVKERRGNRATCVCVPLPRSHVGPMLTCHRSAPRVPTCTTILLAPTHCMLALPTGSTHRPMLCLLQVLDPALLLAKGARGLPHVLPRPLSRCSPRGAAASCPGR